MRRVLVLFLCGTLAGCSLVEGMGEAAAPAAEGESRGGVTPDVLVRPQARPDRGDEVEATAEENAPEDSAGTLGRTIASLGNAAEPGLWLKTPLVQAERPGRVTFPATGKSVQVTLIPIEGPATAGSRLSLQAMQALGAPLTGLPEIDVFAG